MYKLYNFGERLAQIRKEKGLSQNRLCIRAGIALNSVNLYENKGIMPSVTTLCSLAEALGVPVGVLVGEEVE